MSEFIERVACAMQEACEGPVGDFEHGNFARPHGTYVKCARAAIAAMEQPSQKMIDAGNALDDEGSPNDGDYGRVATADEHWRAMITAELKLD